MLKKLFLSSLLVLAVGFSQAGNKNVILRVSKFTQPDTLGYNIMSQLPGVVYEAIQSGKAKLWDSQQKKIEISPATLKDIEKSYKMSFRDIDNMFLYEIWTEKKKNITFTVQGILFATRNDKNEEVSFGYVDYKEVESLFGTALLPVNANGYINTDIGQVLLSKRYDYSLVQYGTKLITNTTLSEKIKNDLFHKKTLVYTGEVVQQVKRIIYTLEWVDSGDEQQQRANSILDSIQAYLKSNPEEYFNMGAERFDSFVNPTKLKVNKAEVVELWMKNQNILSYKPEQVIVYCSDFSLEPQAIERINEWRLKAGGKSIEENLRQKQFTYRVIKINDQPVGEAEAGKYTEALANSSWSRLTEYVKQR